jgi:predicted ABC-type exoprotein transport system permease subunit
VPRVVNLALAALLLLFLVPLFTHLGGRATSVQVMLVLVSVPFLLLTMMCLASAARPGSLSRLARRARAASRR